MNRILLLLLLVAAAIGAEAQENIFTVSGGYSFANIKNIETNTTGWRINSLYEFAPMGGNFSHGISLGYINTGAEVDESETTISYKTHSIPFYYAPKYTFGENTFKVFVKGVFGMHYSGLKRTGGLTGIESKVFDFGFYGGASAGILYEINELVFINAEYEWAYLSNFWHGEGFFNSVMLGLGFWFD